MTSSRVIRASPCPCKIVATALVSIPASSDIVKSKGRQKKQCRRKHKIQITIPLKKFDILFPVERQVKVLIKNLAIFFLCPSKQFLPISFQIQLLVHFPKKQKEQIHKQLGYILISWLPHKFRSLKILGPLCNFKIQQQLI